MDVVDAGAYKALLGLTRASRSTQRRAHLPKSLTELVSVRASWLNGCHACLSVHVPLALRAGATQEQINALTQNLDGNPLHADPHGVALQPAATHSTEHPAAGLFPPEFFSAEERAALGVAECLTRTADPVWGDEAALRHAQDHALTLFSPEQLSALQWTIVTINAFNRVSIASDHPPVDAPESPATTPAITPTTPPTNTEPDSQQATPN